MMMELIKLETGLQLFIFSDKSELTFAINSNQTLYITILFC